MFCEKLVSGIVAGFVIGICAAILLLAYLEASLNFR